MRKKHSFDKYNPDNLREVFGTSNPSEVTVVRWKNKWKYDRPCVPVSSLSRAYSIIKDSSDIDPLFYQFCQDKNARLNVVFFKEEDYVLFKLLYHSD